MPKLQRGMLSEERRPDLLVRRGREFQIVPDRFVREVGLSRVEIGRLQEVVGLLDIRLERVRFGRLSWGPA